MAILKEFKFHCQTQNWMSKIRRYQETHEKLELLDCLGRGNEKHPTMAI